MTDKEKTAFKFHSGGRYHFAGAGGIGMSGLARMFADMGAKVSGSDRGMGLPENAAIFSALERGGVKLYKQDGSYVKDGVPDAVIYSTAIENDNPDFACLPETCRKVHRADALAGAMSGAGEKILAVTGTCGKTSVSAWIAETLFLLGKNPSFLTGGLVNRFRTEELAGNYRGGGGDYFVFEADESDKSLLAFSPGWSVILNVGSDHYPEETLLDVFAKFTDNTSRGALIEKTVLDKIGRGRVKKDLNLVTFGDAENGADQSVKWRLTGYSAVAEGSVAEINGDIRVRLPAPGRHNAMNALTVIAALDMLGVTESLKTIAEAVSEFKGVWRRFNFAGKTKSGARVYDDYAHNPEKLVSCIGAAREICRGKIITLFQPHGYGPLGFMKDKIFEAMESGLSKDDIFALTPVFYAGGTSSFKPKSEDVVKEFQSKRPSKKYLSFGSRPEAEKFLRENAGKEDIILVAGARDNSLSDWAASIASGI
jgi:UDP-N-acetylmuramate--alanine ligase